MLPINILQEVSAGWSEYEIQLENILDNYRIDTDDLPLLSSYLTNANFNTGLFLLDKAGLATHLLGLRLIKLWQENKIFNPTCQVLWLPLAKITQLPVIPNANEVNTSLEALADLTELKFEAAAKTLIIVTGIDSVLQKDFENSEFKKLAALWLKVLEQIPHIVIGNYKPELFDSYQHKSIALSNIYLNLDYELNDSNHRQEHITLPGNILVDEATRHTSRLFRFEHDNPDGVFSIENSTIRNYMEGKVDLVPEEKKEVDHLQPLLTLQEIIRLLAGQTKEDMVNRSIPVLDTPAKWYYAAISAQKIHDTNKKKKYFIYQISGHLIVRRMTDSSMHYLTDLGIASQYQVQNKLHTKISNNRNLMTMLHNIIQQDDFENLDNKRIVAALKQERNKLIRLATESRNAKLLKEGKPIKQEREMLSADTEELFKNITKLFNSDYSDKEIKDSLKILPGSEKDASYQAIQAKINNLYALDYNDYEICRQMIRIIQGQSVDSVFNSLIILLAANLLGESARNTRTFFAFFAKLEIAIIENNDKNWLNYAAYPARINIDMHSASWVDLIRADCMDSIGGLHPMSHAGSYYQTNPKDDGIVCGISWPELKAQLLYLKWFTTALNFSSIGIKYTKSAIFFDIHDSSDYRLITPRNQRFLMSEFELYLRIQTTYSILPEQQIDILNIQSRPFERAINMIADLKQINVIEIKHANDSFGFILSIPILEGNIEKQHNIHLTPAQAYLIATKFDALGGENLTNAICIYNYLCKRHPENIGFRHARLQCLVLHPNLMKNRSLRLDAEADLNFFDRNRGHLPGRESIKKIDYFGAIFSIRAVIENDKFLQPRNSDVAIGTFEGAIKKAIAIIPSFSDTEEELSELYLYLAATYYRQFCCIRNNEKIKQANQHMISYASYAQKQWLIYLTKYAMKLHRTSSADAARLEELFKHMISEPNLIDQTILSGELLRDRYQSHWKKHETTNNNIPEYIILAKQTILTYVNALIPYTKRSNVKLKKMCKEMLKFGNDKHKKYNPLITEGFAKLKNSQIKTEIIHEKGIYSLLINTLHHISPVIIMAWAEQCGIKAELSVDFEVGPCVKLVFEHINLTRNNLQPTPHPHSYLTLTHEIVESKRSDKYFHAINSIFNECVEEIRKYDIGSGQVEKFYYHIYGVFTRLPKLHLIKDGRIQSVVVELPNCTPIKYVLTWIQRYNLAYYWINDKNLGRCIFLPHINILSQHSEYNPAISNGDCIRPYTNKKISNIQTNSKITGSRLLAYSHNFYSAAIELLEVTNNIVATLQVDNTPIPSHLIPEFEQQHMRANRRANDYRRALEQSNAEDINYADLEFIHHDTLNDGNCALNAVALGLLYLEKNHNKHLLINHDGLRKEFAKVFNVQEQTLSKEYFLKIIEALISYDINLENPIISKIIKTLSNLQFVAEGTQCDQITAKINAYKGRIIKDDAYTQGNIKPEAKNDAIRCLAGQGVLYQLILAHVLRQYCASRNGSVFKCYTHHLNGSDSFIDDYIEYTLSASRHSGVYLDDKIFAFLAQEFGLIINIKTNGTQSEVTYGKIPNFFGIYNINPSEAADSHFELFLPAEEVFLKNNLIIVPPDSLSSISADQKTSTENILDQVSSVTNTGAIHYQRELKNEVSIEEESELESIEDSTEEKKTNCYEKLKFFLTENEKREKSVLEQEVDDLLQDMNLSIDYRLDGNVKIIKDFKKSLSAHDDIPKMRKFSLSESGAKDYLAYLENSIRNIKESEQNNQSHSSRKFTTGGRRF